MIATFFHQFVRIIPQSRVTRAVLLLTTLLALGGAVVACGLNPFEDPVQKAMPAPPPAQAPTLTPSPYPRQLVTSVPATPALQDQRISRRPVAKNGSVQLAPDPSTIPVYSPFDFLTGYLSNNTTPILVDGKPWDYGSTNMIQLRDAGGGTTYWDYWSEQEPWDSPNHLWHDDQGKWYTYKTETVTDSSGKKTTSYVLFERTGPGVMDKLWFTQDPTRAFLSILTQVNLFWSPDPPDVTDWGSLSKLGNLRIEVDGKIVYDGNVEAWFSGDAQQIPAALRQLFVWRYGQFGSDGNIIPITYQSHIKVSVYGGSGKPKWFMATGMSFPAGTLVKPSTGATTDLALDQMASLAPNVLNPEDYISTLNGRQSYDVSVHAGAPSSLQVQGADTVSALQFRLAKTYDPRRLWLRVAYGTDVGIDVPLLGFFSEPGQISLHHSTPSGLIDTGDSYLFYSNLPMPYQSGLTIELDTDSTDPIPVHVEVATSEPTTDTQLRVLYQPAQNLQALGPDFALDVPGSGKVVGLVLQTYDQVYDKVPFEKDKKTGQEDASKKKWPMGYLEGNLTLVDGNGNTRYYSGQEDWAEGGYYFNSGYTTPPGGANRPFAGILRYSAGKDGYATLFRYFNDLSAFRFYNGLHLSFGHGTWHNNFPVTYGATLFYYSQVPGMTSTMLPASDYAGLGAAPPVNSTSP